MLGAIKGLVRKAFNNTRFPAAMEFYRKRDAQKWLELQEKIREHCERNSQMTYAEIESEISSVYERMYKRKLVWDNPQTYNEKIHVSKIYMPTPEKTRLADKYLVREWITEKIGGEYLIPLLGVYENFDEINFDELPNEFVIKCNHDCASVTLVKDKSKIDKNFLRRKYDILMRIDYAWFAWEMHYKDIKPKIIIEKYMGEAINDYKFLCFDGKPFYCWVDIDRFTNHTRNFYDLDWKRQPFTRTYSGSVEDIERPAKFDEMKEIVKELCDDFDHVRTDLYFIDGKIYFGEMTFTTEGGFGKFAPDEYDYKLGELWPFDNSVRKKVLAEHSRP